MEWNGTEWALALDYDDQPLQTPNLDEWEMDSTPLFRLYLVAKDDLWDGERADRSSRVRGGTITVRPRWPDMRTEDGTLVRGVPDLGGPYVDFQLQLSNVDHRRYRELLESVVSAWGINRRYVHDPHPASNVQDAAVYVRVRRGRSGPLFAPDGPIARTHGVLEGSQSGLRKHVEDHRRIPGYYVTTVLDASRVRDVLPGHVAGKEVKHYYPKDP
jgi:hypothetical protein